MTEPNRQNRIQVGGEPADPWQRIELHEAEEAFLSMERSQRARVIEYMKTLLAGGRIMFPGGRRAGKATLVNHIRELMQQSDNSPGLGGQNPDLTGDEPMLGGKPE
jgi:hypothetical protein